MEAQMTKVERFENDAFWLTTEDGQEYRISSINDNCSNKLMSIIETNDGKCFITLEKITEYHSNEYRCKISTVNTPGWRDDDAYCLVANETGNRNPNAERDIAAARETLKMLGIL